MRAPHSIGLRAKRQRSAYGSSFTDPWENGVTIYACWCQSARPAFEHGCFEVFKRNYVFPFFSVRGLNAERAHTLWDIALSRLTWRLQACPVARQRGPPVASL